MASEVSQAQEAGWLLEHGPGELELLFRAIVSRPFAPIPTADNESGLPEAGAAARNGDPQGHLRLVGRDETLWDLGVTAGIGQVPGWVEDCALCLLDANRQIAGWYAGSSHIYGFTAEEAIGRPVTLLCPSEENPDAELDRAESDGHFGSECWHLRKDGSRFWANVITLALSDETGELQGFARAVRDFTERHERDEKLRRSRARVRSLPAAPAVAGVVTGEFDHVPEVNDAFLERSSDLVSGDADDPAGENVLTLSDEFFAEIMAHPVPEDLHAVKILVVTPGFSISILLS